MLARFDDLAQIGFEIERNEAGWVAVYLPGSPDPRSRSVCHLTADRVEPIDASFHSLIKSFKMLGRGTTATLPPPPDPE